MIVKFFKRGSGSCSATMNYLLGKDRNREHAKILQGDPELTRQLADSLEFKNRYTVGVLSFEEKDLDDKTKKKIMADFEESLLCGLEHDQYNICWIEHKDKDRLELNFVIPKVELNTGRAMNPYFDAVDRKRVNAFKDHINAKYDLTDPNDPANRQPHTLNMQLPKDKKELQEAITGYLMGEIGQGRVKHHQDVLNAIQSDLGLSVARITPNSISIKDPINENGRNIRLKGEIYANTFRFSQNYSAENERASREYRENRNNRISETGKKLTAEIERKREFNQQRYNKPRKEPERANQQDTGLQNSDRGHNGLAIGDNHGLGDIQPIPSQEYPQSTGRIRHDTAEHRIITTTSQDFEQSEDWRERWQIFHHQRTQENRNLHINQKQPSNDLSEQIGLLDHAKRLHEQLQRLTERVRTSIKPATGDHRQTEMADRAITNSQRQINDTERQINQSEQTIKDLSRANQEFSRKQKAVNRGFER